MFEMFETFLSTWAPYKQANSVSRNFSFSQRYLRKMFVHVVNDYADTCQRSQRLYGHHVSVVNEIILLWKKYKKPKKKIQGTVSVAVRREKNSWNNTEIKLLYILHCTDLKKFVFKICVTIEIPYEAEFQWYCTVHLHGKTPLNDFIFFYLTILI